MLVWWLLVWVDAQVESDVVVADLRLKYSQLIPTMMCAQLDGGVSLAEN